MGCNAKETNKQTIQVHVAKVQVSVILVPLVRNTSDVNLSE